MLYAPLVAPAVLGPVLQTSEITKKHLFINCFLKRSRSPILIHKYREHQRHNNFHKAAETMIIQEARERRLKTRDGGKVLTSVGLAQGKNENVEVAFPGGLRRPQCEREVKGKGLKRLGFHGQLWAWGDPLFNCKMGTV